MSEFPVVVAHIQMSVSVRRAFMSATSVLNAAVADRGLAIMVFRVRALERFAIAAIVRETDIGDFAAGDGAFRNAIRKPDSSGTAESRATEP